jgi:integrase
MAAISAPVVANQTLSAASAIFNWAIREEIVSLNPCARVERNATKSRERVLSDGELPKFWTAFEAAGLVKCNALRMILLTGQRPGEVRYMRREHIIDGWWEMPGEPVEALQWPGTKNKHSHRVWLPIPALEILAAMPDEGQIFGGVPLDTAMRKACATLDAEAKELGVHGVPRTTPHDLRRTHGTTITALGFGRDGMNRVQNHVEGGIASVYDRHEYAEENKKIMETVAQTIIGLAGVPKSICMMADPLTPNPRNLVPHTPQRVPRVVRSATKNHVS